MPVTRITLGLLFVATVFLEFSSADTLQYYAKLRNSMHKSQESTPEPLNDGAPDEKIHYSVANVTNDFRSNTKFQARGMAHLYMLTEKFIQFIGKGEAFPDRKYTQTFKCQSSLPLRSFTRNFYDRVSLRKLHNVVMKPGIRSTTSENTWYAFVYKVIFWICVWYSWKQRPWGIDYWEASLGGGLQSSTRVEWFCLRTLVFCVFVFDSSQLLSQP